MTMRPILFPEDVCSVNQTFPPESRATEFGPEVLVGSGYSENLLVTCGPIVVVTEDLVLILAVLKLAEGLLIDVVETWKPPPGHGDTPMLVPPVRVHSELEAN